MNKHMEQLKSLSGQELEVSLLDTSKDIYKTRNELNQNKKLDKPHQLIELKKKRARILTLLNQMRGSV
jgi:ribosomal protein L29